jgi:2,5-furandicarboxylate decarboxylase 1
VAPDLQLRKLDHGGHMSSLRSFLDGLSPQDILRVTEPVPLDYTGTALVLELEKQKRFPVVMFENPIGFDMPVVMNLFSDRRRIDLMAGCAPGTFHAHWPGIVERLIAPRIVDSGPVQEVVLRGEEADASTLPISRHFEADAGRYIGSGILVCKDPDTGTRNLSFQRLQLKGPRKFGTSLHSRGHIFEHLQRCEARGRNLEVAIVIGCHPAIYLAGGAKVGMEVDEFDIAGALMKKPVDLVRCKTVDLEVPAEAEIVLEGEILGGVLEEEGPFGEYTGYSTARSTRNVFVCKAITRRHSPIWQDLVPGYSMEHLVLGRASKEAHVFNRLKEIVPNLVTINYPRSGTHFHAYLSLRNPAPGQARLALTALFGLDHYVKFAVAVDDDVDVFDEEEVLWALATRFQADRDMFMVPEVFCNRLDPSSENGTSAKLGLDATRRAGFDAVRTSLPASVVEWARGIVAAR